MGAWRMGYGRLEDGIWNPGGWGIGGWSMVYESLEDGMGG